MWEDYSLLNNVKVAYIRHNSENRYRDKRGILVSGIDDYGKVCIGWSLCNESEGDVFDKYRGFEIAEARAHNNDRLEKYLPDYNEEDDECIDPVFDLVDDIIPQSIHSDLGKFVDRAKLYYKDAEFADAVEYMHVKL